MGIEVIAAYLILAILVGFWAKGNGRSFFVYFLISFLFSPIVGMLMLLIAGKAKPDAIIIIKDNNEESNNNNIEIQQTDENIQIDVTDPDKFEMIKDAVRHYAKDNGLQIQEDEYTIKASNNTSKINVTTTPKKLIISTNMPALANKIHKLLTMNPEKEKEDAIKIANALEKLAKMYKDGILSKEEFEAQKQRILQGA
ncbi:hypothetical protein NrS5_37 [Nitratiruptor phage NrS-5]|uniref:SHOCT domain-containing protein n=1 Tax=unclassified Nitratiruptor TaxID=2624044 RepID=UPI001916C36C|nr:MULTISPECIES: SHOCT domain-containing protein [unclassified Nitratiruptor]BCD61741.1 hypothetical protein NitYY0813_C0601 [Nitratiruptor sp. YY08-13]BCD65676.1 hypothetical protein NitYY0826_C0603 [Nitratiruptor sp. YY08-26]BCD83219.1 hypothetical protein NrS4_37 [Nitratiruptor phage NrS-4]BCD83278.1 hypothetical protein NrS5_37 [Nitratiruptor phage NrS-5]